MEVVVALVVPPLLTAAMNTLMPKMLQLVNERSRLRQDVKNDINALKRELEAMCSASQDYRKKLAQSKDLGALQATWILGVSNLALKIEDCVDRYIYNQASGSGEMPNFDQFANDIKTLKTESDEISNLREKYEVRTGGGTDSILPSAVEPDSTGSCSPVVPNNLVGTDVPLRELLDLVEEEEAEGQLKDLKVISILGFDGLGKTALAAQVYNADDVTQKFGNKRAWVNAVGKDSRQVLQEILRQVQPEPIRDTRSCEQLCELVRGCLQNERYFIVIDDMRTYLWSSIKPAFPENNGFSSRVVVTTSSQPIASGCCSKTGYVYRMPGLDANFSDDLFFRTVNVRQPSPDLKTGSEELRKKCDGLPLALVSAAELLTLRKDGLTPTGRTCKDVCSNLGSHLEKADKDTASARMQEVLIRSYDYLTEDALKACLVCIGMFPSSHRIRRKRLIRRWMAEGLFEVSPNYKHSPMDKAVENFKMLIDCNILEPINVSYNDVVRTCQTRGMMLEFIRHRSMSENSTTLFCDKMRLEIPQHARRLSLHHRTAPNVEQGCDLSLIRSLSIFGKACEDILKFNEYRLLRVLDLEDCDDLTNDHLKDISKLLLLNYLGLGGKVTELPKEIGMLVYLQTLDVKGANAEVSIPIEVVMLTNLTNLLGKFKLSGTVSKKILEFFKQGKSNLQILAGFVTDGNNGFLQLMVHMKNLRKVKIWCKSSTGSSVLTTISSAVQRYIEDGKDPNSKRYLSLDSDASFRGMTTQFSPGAVFYITSLKLRGDLLKLPDFVASLTNLEELCLSTTTTLDPNIFIILSKLTCLVYLKLVAAELGNFVIRDETKFESLQRLCVMVQRPPLLEIQGHTLPQLASFQLFCNEQTNVENLPLINIEHIESLREVSVYCTENEELRGRWEDAAKRHPNRPRIFFVEKGSAPAEDSVATEQTASHQKRNRSKFSNFLNKLGLNRGRTRSSSIVCTNNGQQDSISLTHEASRAQAETSGSTEGPTADCCVTPHVSCPSQVGESTAGS